MVSLKISQYDHKGRIASVGHASEKYNDLGMFAIIRLTGRLHTNFYYGFSKEDALEVRNELFPPRKTS